MPWTCKNKHGIDQAERTPYEMTTDHSFSTHKAYLGTAAHGVGILDTVAKPMAFYKCEHQI